MSWYIDGCLRPFESPKVRTLRVPHDEMALCERGVAGGIECGAAGVRPLAGRREDKCRCFYPFTLGLQW